MRQYLFLSTTSIDFLSLLSTLYSMESYQADNNLIYSVNYDGLFIILM